MTVAIHSGNFQPSELERKQYAVSQQRLDIFRFMCDAVVGHRDLDLPLGFLAKLF